MDIRCELWEDTALLFFLPSFLPFFLPNDNARTFRTKVHAYEHFLSFSPLREVAHRHGRDLNRFVEFSRGARNYLKKEGKGKDSENVWPAPDAYLDWIRIIRNAPSAATLNSSERSRPPRGSWNDSRLLKLLEIRAISGWNRKPEAAWEERECVIAFTQGQRVNFGYEPLLHTHNGNYTRLRAWVESANVSLHLFPDKRERMERSFYVERVPNRDNAMCAVRISFVYTSCFVTCRLSPCAVVPAAVFFFFLFLTKLFATFSASN